MARRFAGLWLALAALGGCTGTVRPSPPAAPAATVREARAPVTILISIDGFRPDYRGRGVTPALNALAAAGISAAMRPSFPSKTFPNHWTLVTGLRPDRNGIVANKMEDTRRPGETFTMSTDDPFWWDESVPVWTDAEAAGIRTATIFWPGSNVAIGGTLEKGKHDEVVGGTRPQDWAEYNEAVTAAQRVNMTLDVLRRPAAIRPRFVTLYFETVDTAGHDFGPDAAETTAAAAGVDRAIGDLVAGLAAMAQPVNFVIVADHGMAATSSKRVIALDRVADPADYRTIETGPYAALFAVPGHEAALEAKLLRAHPHMTCWRKADIPARLAYGRNPRVPPYLCLAEVGWLIEKTAPEKAETGGGHGYDNAAPEMAALFIASGPAIRAGGTIARFDNVDVAPLLRDLIGLPPAARADGDDAPFRAYLKR